MVVGCNSETLFKRLSPGSTGIDFNNRIVEDDHHNVYQFMNFYTGAGVAAGDINNDGLTDLYFSGNMEPGRLYLNQGGLKFQDISESSGVINTKWGSGCTMIDINQDGWLDIYVTVSGSGLSSQLGNLLYINNGDNTFKESAAEYGIDDERQTQHSAFFDYDLDGDLDLFLIINPAAYEQKVNVVTPRKLNGEGISTDALYRNNGDGTFTEVSEQAGIKIEGYSLGVGISDINNDGWPDIYISNDFVGNDVLYINQQDGSFLDKAEMMLQHTSYAGMGNDLADFNNDGLVDIMVLDMRPEDNLRQKLIISSTSYDLFQLMIDRGYMPQYSRNTLQLNRGEGYFSEVGYLSGVSSTDWSWSALFADYDNDGDKDLFVTNGFLRDLGNLDYIHYQNIYDTPLGEAETKIKKKLEDIRNLEGADLQDYLFENEGGLQFVKRSDTWGIKGQGFSHGAVYVDLDNDGDLELVVNNTNEPAHVYQNLSETKNQNNFLQIKLLGPDNNRQGIGSRIELYQHNRKQLYEHYLSRGYESSVDPKPHFGLGTEQIDSLIIRWPDGKSQTLLQVTPNQLLTLDYQQAYYTNAIKDTESRLFQAVETPVVEYSHRENAQVDFKIQPILPHMHSQLGPGISAGDVNQDGYQDVFIGGASGQSGKLFLNHRDSLFQAQAWDYDSLFEDMGCLFFDVESDGDLDLYVVSGGTTHPKGSQHYQDRLYLNQGNGEFSEPILMPASSSGSCVTGADYDQDGDIDLFVGGRVQPGNYPLPPKSYLLRNDTPTGGNPRFTDVTHEIDGLSDIGMVTSAIWSDHDNDGWLDLLIVGEFMPITLVANNHGVLNLTNAPGLESSEGWWNSINGGDFDNDGDIDYILGNLGLNSKYKANLTEPLCIYASDYDKNGRIDPVMCYYLDGKNYIAHTRDELISQISAMRARFKTYQEYAEATFDRSFLPSELEQAFVVKAYQLQSSYLENLSDGSFKIHQLPMEAQMAPVYGTLVDDFDHNGTLDVLLTGNSYSTEVSTGRYDSSYGLVLLGDGSGSWNPLDLSKSGIINKGDAKAMVSLPYQGRNLILVSNNSGAVNAFISNRATFKGNTDSDRDTSSRTSEHYLGSGYLSQSASKH